MSSVASLGASHAPSQQLSQSKASSEVQTSTLKKANNVQKQEGQNVDKLLQSAKASTPTGGANKIDVFA